MRINLILLTGLICFSGISFCGLAHAEKSSTEKHQPSIRALPLHKKTSVLPMKTIAPFLNRSQILDSKTAEATPVVMAIAPEHILAGKGDKVYFRAKRGMSIDMGQNFYVLRQAKTYQDPRTQKVLGVEYEMVGEGRVVSQENNNFTLLLTKSLREIQIGDQLLKMTDQRVDDIVMRIPLDAARGQIISVFGGVNQIGEYEAVTITGGQDAGRQIGDELAIYQRQDREKVGRLVVFSVFDKVSFGLIVKAQGSINLLDEVARP